MIHPRISMVDLDPEGFAVVSRLLGRHIGTPGRELHVLHRDGVVLRAVDTAAGVLNDWAGSRIQTDPARLRADAGADRVILVDERHEADLASSLARAAAAQTQDEMMVRSRRTFLSHPGVAVDPPPSFGVWDAWSKYLRSLGDDYLALAAGLENESCVFALLGRIRNGLLDRVTSLPDTSGAPETILERARHAGDLRLAVVAGVDAFDEALTHRALAPLLTRAAVALGLPEGIP